MRRCRANDAPIPSASVGRGRATASAYPHLWHWPPRQHVIASLQQIRHADFDLPGGSLTIDYPLLPPLDQALHSRYTGIQAAQGRVRAMCTGFISQEYNTDHAHQDIERGQNWVAKARYGRVHQAGCGAGRRGPRSSRCRRRGPRRLHSPRAGRSCRRGRAGKSTPLHQRS